MPVIAQPSPCCSNLTSASVRDRVGRVALRRRARPRAPSRSSPRARRRSAPPGWCPRRPGCASANEYGPSKAPDRTHPAVPESIAPFHSACAVRVGMGFLLRSLQCSPDEPRTAPHLPGHRRHHRGRRSDRARRAAATKPTRRPTRRQRRPRTTVRHRRGDRHADPEPKPQRRRCCRPARSGRSASTRATPCASASATATAEEVHIHGYDIKKELAAERDGRRVVRGVDPRDLRDRARALGHAARASEGRAVGLARACCHKVVTKSIFPLGCANASRLRTG